MVSVIGVLAGLGKRCGVARGHHRATLTRRRPGQDGIVPSSHLTDARLVVVPGLGLDGRSWRPTLDALAAGGWPAGADVVLLPAYGVRAARRTPLAPTMLAEGLVDRLLPEGRQVLLGHSASCQVVVQAARRTTAVAALVLVGPTTDPRATGWRRLARRWLATARHEPPGQAPALARQYTRTGLLSMARGMDAARREPIEEALADVGCPVLLLRGRHDRIAPGDWLHLLAGEGGPTRVVTLPAGGHMVPFTHGELVADEILAWLADLDA
jgi:pimeloyl-ACP methyl ester carboxylesterase